MKTIKPQRLHPGDTVAIVSPSWGGPSVFPGIYELGLRVLRDEFGLHIKEYPTARTDAETLYRQPQLRADDINLGFADSQVKAIIVSIGGDDSVRILPYLDAEVIRRNPKILMGYSDTTTLLTVVNQLGLVTFNGPTVMSGFSQLRSWPHEFAIHLRAMLFEPSPTYEYQPYDIWSEGFPDWSDPANVGKVNPYRANDEGWRWLQGSGRVRGPLFGGCIEVLEFMKGTAFWPAPNFWHGKILFFETSEDKPTPQQVTWMLRNYGMQGIFDKINGVLMGRPRDYADDEKKALYEALVTVVAQEFGRADLPIIANVDFGHTDPQVILPLGVPVEIDCDKQSLTLLEPAVA